MEALYFNKKLIQFQKSELERVDATFSPLIETASKKQSEAYTLYQQVDRKAKLEDRKLFPYELELKKKYLEADKEYNDLMDEWHKEQKHSKVSAEKLTFEFFTKNTKSIISLLKHDIPLQITISALIVLDLSFVHEYKNFSENNNLNSKKDNPSEAEIVHFQDDVLREHLISVFKPFLDFLKDHDKDGFKKACELIEKGIKNKKKILADVRKKMLTVFQDTPQTEGTQQEDIIKTNTHLAKEVISGTTKLEQVIFDARRNPVFYDTDITAIDVNVGKKGKSTITTIASIDFNNMKKMGVSISHEKWITPFDREILSIVSSLYAAGNVYQSPQMIFQAMSGNKEKVKLTPEIRAKIIESLRKLRATTIEIDASQEEKAGWAKKGKYEGSLLPSERVEIVMLNGQKIVDCIHFLRNSPLYDYAEGKNQISRVNIEMLQAPVNNTTENIELKFYLLRLISSMKNSKSKIKPVFRYDTIYEYLGVDENDNYAKQKKKDIRDRVKKILNFWVEKGFILGFEEEWEGKNIAKVKISL